MTRKVIPLALSLLAATLAACSAATAEPPTPLPTPAAILVTSSPPTQAPAPATAAIAGMAQTDSQGAVEFVVTPLNLAAPGDTLDFSVSMNTHSVDVSWNLAAQSVLSTDAGAEVQGLSWPVGGGHHYEGTLIFPAQTDDGRPLLEGAQTLTLTIQGTDVAERVFVWELSG
jgi:hypothetical protein